MTSSWISYFLFVANGGEITPLYVFIFVILPSKLTSTKHHCVSLGLEIVCSSTKLTFVSMLSAWCVFHVFGCASSVYDLSSHWVRVYLLWVFVVIERMVNSKGFQIRISWTHTQENTEHTLALICWVAWRFNIFLLMCNPQWHLPNTC